MCALIAEVPGHDAQRRCDFALHVQVPRLDVIILEIGINCPHREATALRITHQRRKARRRLGS